MTFATTALAANAPRPLAAAPALAIVPAAPVESVAALTPAPPVPRPAAAVMLTPEAPAPTPPPASAAPPPPAGAPPAPAGDVRPAAGERREHRAAQLERRHDRQDDRQRRPLAANLEVEGGARRAAVEVAADDAAPRQRARARRQMAADLGAGRVARRPRAQQTLARLEHERLDLRALDVEHLRDLGVRVVPELEQDERGALVLGQPVEILDEVAQIGAKLDGVGESLADRAVARRVGHRLAGAAGAQDGEAAVARDRVEPGLQRRGPVAGARERAVGRGEGVLQRVLGLLPASQHVPAERDEAAVVAIVDGLEGRDAAVPRER